jgi:DNA-binding PadR family transcriptional regulator
VEKLAKTNKTKYAIMGVLSIKPSSGYDIKKFCDNSLSHFWNENYGHIYPVLRQLELDGWAEKNTQISDGKLRNVYHITPAGKKALLAWLEQPPEIPAARYEFLLKMFFSLEIPAELSVKRLEDSCALCRDYLERYRKMEAKMQGIMAKKENPNVPYWYTTLRYGILSMQANIQWCEESIEMLKTTGKENNSNEKNTDL